MTTADPQRAPGTRAEPPGAVVRLRHAAVSAAFETADATAAVFAGLRRAAAGPRRRIVELAGRGAREPARACRWAAETVQAAVTAVAPVPMLEQIVDAQLARVLRPVVRAVLEDVLCQLEREQEQEQEPDRIRAGIRTADADGGTTVDRLATPVPPVPGDGS